MSSEVSNPLHSGIDNGSWHTAGLRVTVGADEGDEESDVDELHESFRAWSAVAGPSTTIEQQIDRTNPLFGPQIASGRFDECSVDFKSVLSDLFADGNRLFQPLSDNNFADEVFAEKKPKIINGYLFGDIVGEGSYGKVKEVLEEATLVRRAVKIIKDSRLRKIPNGRANVEQELRILRRVRHRNVISLCEVFRNEEKEKLYMVMEYCIGSLQQMLDGSKEKKLPTFQAHYFFTQLTDGLSYLHAQGVIHKDIKPGNLLVSLNGTLKISDFGVAELLDRFESEDWCTLAQGTPKFQPPEVVHGTAERYRGRKADIWACGVTLYNLVSGEYPFEGDMLMRLFDNIANQPLKMPMNVKLPESLELLLDFMLKKDPEERINMHDIRRSDWYLQRHVVNDSLRVPVSVCNNVPAHRPLSVYAPLEQMYGNAMSDEVENDEMVTSIEETVSSSKLINFDSEVPPGEASNAPSSLNESKRNRSILSMCMGSSSRSP